MKLYIAGLYGAAFDLESRLMKRLDEREAASRRAVTLFSETYVAMHKPPHADRLRQDGKKIFLEPGTPDKNNAIDLMAYTGFINKNVDIIQHATALTVLGTGKGSFDNFRRMQSLGAAPLPCFNYGDTESFLKHYIANHSYVALGGMRGVPAPQVAKWLDRIWSKFLTDSSGRPIVKVHGCSLASIALINAYPWHSVSSGSWEQASSRGALLLDNFGLVPVSDTSPARKVFGSHFCSYAPLVQNAIRVDLSTMGFDLDRLRVVPAARMAFNAWALHKIGEAADAAINNKTFIPVQRGLF